MKSLIIVMFVMMSSLLHAGDYHDRGSWKHSLQEKALYFEKNAAERHNIEGTYPSSVRLHPPEYYAGSQQGAWGKINTTGELPPGWFVDQGTTGLSNIAHTSSWTGCLLTGEAFHVAFLRKKYGENSPEYKAASKRADEIISGIRKLTLVSGQPGYLARGFAMGHGVTYGEREYAWGESGTGDLWHQGVGNLSYLRYRGGPSHHNYDQVFRGLGFYYFLAADKRQKENIREIVTDMSDWAHLKNNMVVMLEDGQRISTELIGGWRGLGGNTQPSGGSLLATTGLKIAYLITGNKRVKQLYDKWVDVLGYRKFKDSDQSIMGPPRGNYDDSDHLLADLYLLNLIEKDPDLLAFYHKCVKDSWKAHKDEKLAWFNFIYRAVLGDEYADPDGSIWNLQTFPTCRIFQPRMNSIRADIEFYAHDGKKEALHPLPVYERPSDNEYEWKGNPFRLDGWLSRIVTILEISPLDPYVQVAADESGWAYYSNTKGEVWRQMKDLTGVHDLLFSPNYPPMIFAATDNGVYRTFDGGVSWSKSFDHPVKSLCFDPEDTHVLYAVAADGIYKSSDFGRKEMGAEWRLISGETPLSSAKYFAVDPRGEHAKMYLLTKNGLYKMIEGDADWTAPPRPVRRRGFSDLQALPGKPLWIRVDDTTPNRFFRAIAISEWRYSGALISVSEDGGKTWSTIVRQAAPLFGWLNSTGQVGALSRDDLMQLFGILVKLPIQDVRVDRTDPNTWYGQLKDGVAVTHDAGKTWSVSNKGLDIPRVNALYVPRHSKDIYIGTPAGLYVSHNQGASWDDTSLILQEGGALRAEIGGNGYLEAYWMGRYHSFISDEEATRTWWK